MSLMLLSWYALLSLLAIALYGFDKSAARKGARRTPEIHLHLVALAGGWPGAIAGQRLFRHKTRKQPFRTFFWGTVMVNLALLVWLLSQGPGFPLGAHA